MSQRPPAAALTADPAVLSQLCPSGTGTFEMLFESLFHAGRSLVFPCDCAGHVDLDCFSDRTRANYLYARIMVGREYARPRVMPLDICAQP
ncbi:MAG TPA: hypothetical protein VFU71_22415 [Burkholderiaceae bacterium]|nr:hypothetical protein [Burkholderiaceae bacterium]